MKKKGMKRITKKKMVSKVVEQAKQAPQVETNQGEVKQPVKITRYGRSIATHNVDKEFKNMKRQATDKGMTLVDWSKEQPKRASGGIGIEKPEDPIAGMKKRAATIGSSERVYETFFSPFRQRVAIETPSKRQDLNQWYRFYVKYDPLVGAAIDLHSQFPLSSFEFEHEDPEVGEFFNHVKDKLNLESFIMWMAQEYWTVGESFPFGFLDDPKNPTMWTGFILLDPDNIRLNTHSMVRSTRPYTMSLVPDKDLKKIIDNGPGNPATGPLYKKIPEDIKDCVKENRDIPLNPLQISHFKRVGNYFNPRGESLVSRAIYYLMYRDKLLDANYTIADRHVCYDKETECLTKDGWKKHDQLSINDDIATFNKDTGVLEYQKPSHILVKKYKGKMYRFKKDKVVDLLVTPEHKMLVKKNKYSKELSKKKKKNTYVWSDEWELVPAKDLTYPCKFRTVVDDFKAPDSAPSYVEVGLHHRVPIKQYLEFVGYYLSEGSLSIEQRETARRRTFGETYFVEDDSNSYSVQIGQTITSKYYNDFKNFFESFCLEFGGNTNNQDCTIWQRHDYELGKYLEGNYGAKSNNKHIPTWVKNLPKEYLKILVDAMFKGDGWNRPCSWVCKDGETKSYESGKCYSTVSKQLADDFQEILFKLSYRASISSVRSKKGWQEIYNVMWHETGNVGKHPLIQKKKHVSVEEYNDVIWCPTVPNHIIVVRRNDKIAIHSQSPKEFYFIGESGDPADSEEIEAFSNMLSATWTNPNQAIIWHHAVKVQWEGVSGKTLNIHPELDFIEKQILAGLGISRAFIHGEGPTWATSSVALDVLIAKYKKFREVVENWILQCVLAPLCQMHKIFKTKKSEIKHRFKVKGEKREPWLPNIVWSKGELRDDNERKRFFIQLLDKKLISEDMIRRKFDIDPRIAKKQLEQQITEKYKLSEFDLEKKLESEKKKKEIAEKFDKEFQDAKDTGKGLGLPELMPSETKLPKGGPPPVTGPGPEEWPTPPAGEEVKVEPGEKAEGPLEGGPGKPPESSRPVQAPAEIAEEGK